MADDNVTVMIGLTGSLAIQSDARVDENIEEGIELFVLNEHVEVDVVGASGIRPRAEGDSATDSVGDPFRVEVCREPLGDLEGWEDLVAHV